MGYENLNVDIGDDFVAEITLNRPEQLNTFNTPLAGELVQAFHQLDAETNVRVIIVKGAGKAFCAGIDVNELKGKTAMEYKAWIEHMEKPLVTISRMSKPVIAQVHGVAAANGAGLVAAADLAIAAENTRFGLTAINVGLNCIGPVVPVTRSVGRKRALELLFYGDLIKAPVALEMGGEGSFTRLISRPQDPLRDRLAYAAGVPAETVAARWRSRVLESKPNAQAGLLLSPLSLLVWLILLTAFATRSTRWRLG